MSPVRKDEKVGELRIWLGKQFQTVGGRDRKGTISKTLVSTGDIIVAA